ncbi:hypothetical protein [Streptomyces lavendofoliae]|uniref:hypothetical protein n=1 Tax=Streptomyces lavendofoliae TaxID=67314 RepID=UPI00300E9601
MTEPEEMTARPTGITETAVEVTEVTETAEVPPYPAGGAGIFDVDPDQAGVSQDPDDEVTGDIEALPEDEEI